MRIAIVDESEARAAVVEEGLRDSGYSDITRVRPEGAFVARLEALMPSRGSGPISARRVANWPNASWSTGSAHLDD